MDAHVGRGNRRSRKCARKKPAEVEGRVWNVRRSFVRGKAARRLDAVGVKRGMRCNVLGHRDLYTDSAKLQP